MKLLSALGVRKDTFRKNDRMFIVINYGIMCNKPLIPKEYCFNAKIKGGLSCDKIIFYCLRFHFG